jgi:thymidylate synthase ThyX
MEFTSQKSNIKVRIIADSVSSESGIRLTTFEWEYPRFIHGEVMTHRMLSKNAASSRAVPLAKAVENVLANPAWPVHFGLNEPGMQSRQELAGTDLQAAKSIWSRAMHASTEYARALADLKAHKQWAARILEPFQMMKIVVSGTNWANFLWLRNDEEAQPEFQELARLVQEALDAHQPEMLDPGQWHTPYVGHKWIDDDTLHYIDENGDELTLDDALKISASCCAQVSYRKLDTSREKALEIYGKLFSGRKPHMSPTEHQGTPIKGNVGEEIGITHHSWVDDNLYSGNFCEWIQYRQTLPNNVRPG